MTSLTSFCKGNPILRTDKPLSFLFTILVLMTGFCDSAQAQYKQVRGIIHLDTSVSGGTYDPEQMVRFLEEQGLQVAIFSDQITTGIKYGTFPARGLMESMTGWLAAKKFGRPSSVSTFGANNYLSLLSELNRKYKDMVVIPGVEVFPYYYWQGSLLQNNLTLKNGYKHLLAIGLESPQDYIQMPTIGEGFYREYGLQTLLSLWPVVLLFLALKCWRKARRSTRPSIFKISALIFLIVGFLFLLNNYPYKFGRYTPYHADAGYAPYQDFINYVVDRGGLVFWAHPEVSSDTPYQIGPFKITLKTDAPYEDLLHLHNYTGFAAFYEGMKYVIPPGGIWDQVLTEYCLGGRAHPIWAITEGDVEGDSFDPNLCQTAFLVKQNDRSEIMKSLKEGRIYALSGPLANSLKLENYELKGGGTSAGMGQTLEAQSVQLLAHIVLQDSTQENRSLSVELIKNGVLLDTFKGEGDITITYDDTLTNTNRLHYYRLDVRAPHQSRLLTNPIFVRVPKS